MSLAIGNLRQALRDETRMVLGQEFSVSASTVSTITVFNVAKQKPVYLSLSSANVFVGCLIRFTSGQNEGLYYLVVGAESSIAPDALVPLVLTLDQPFVYAVEVGDQFELYSVPPAYNGQSNVSIGSSTLNYAGNALSGTVEYGRIEPGIFSTPNSEFVLQCQWNTAGPIAVLLQNANGYDGQGNVTGFADLARFVLPGSSTQATLSKSFTARAAFTGPFNNGSFNNSTTFMNIAATLLGPNGASAASLTIGAFAI